MYQEGNYNVLEFFPPAQGMNNNVAPSVLPKGFAVHLENMVARPLGELSLRFGTSLIASIGLNLWPDSEILESFPFLTSDGRKQLILYVTEFNQDMGASEFDVISPNSFSFSTETPQAYVIDTPIKISSTFAEGALTNGYSYISGSSIEDNIVTLTLRENINLDPENTVISKIFYSVGSIYLFDMKTNVLNRLITNLSAGCLPRSTTFLNNLIICNGVDKNMRWDGTSLTLLHEFVKEGAATNLTRLTGTSFSFVLNQVPGGSAPFDIAKYQNNATIELNINGALTQYTVNNISVVDNTVTITTTTTLANFSPGAALLFYQDFPPPFSFIKVAYNRLWGLGTGAVGVQYRSPSQALRVYFSYGVGSISEWFNSATKTVPSINLAENHGIADNLEAIVQTDSFLAFVGRKRTQVWSGFVPDGAPSIPGLPALDFFSLLPIGVAHGNLFVEMANDVTFVSQNGILSYSTLNIAKQFAATPIDAVNPLVLDYLKSITNDNVAYRACRSFKYASGAFLGFKIGENKILTSLYSSAPYSWSVFSGDFGKASSFVTDLDEHLYLLINNKLFVYADQTWEVPSYGDNDGKDLIFGTWQLPEMSFSGKRYANKRCEMIVDHHSSFVLDRRNAVALEIDGDLRKTFVLRGSYPLPFKGDDLGHVAFVDPNDIGNDLNAPDLHALGLRLDEPYSYIKSRLKFASSRFTPHILFTGITSPISIKKIRFFGIVERSF